VVQAAAVKAATQAAQELQAKVIMAVQEALMVLHIQQAAVVAVRVLLAQTRVHFLVEMAVLG
jgi:hypothetical protein